MNAERLVKEFDRLSEAPGAIPRLRQFILDLAVRGKLVEQDLDDEPASELLSRMRTLSIRLVKERVIRRPAPEGVLDPALILFQLPPSWTWCRLSAVGAVVGGGTPPSTDASNFAPGGSANAWLTPADLGQHKGLFIAHGSRDLTEKGLNCSSATLMPKGTVLFTSRAPIGYTAIASKAVATNQGFKSVVPYVPESNLYVATYFRAFATLIDNQAPGTTFREVSGKLVANLPFPLPPLAEQHRIVAKVGELMTLCDQLEAEIEAAQTQLRRLLDALIHTALAESSVPKVPV